MAYIPILPAWPKAPLLYEINTRVWLREIAARHRVPATLEHVPNDELAKIARLGFHGVWLMGVWTSGDEPLAIARTHPDLQAEYKRALPDLAPEDIVASPYAITKYEVSLALGGPRALAAFREKLGRFSLRLILDFVPNHLATDNPLVMVEPDAFIRGGDEDLARAPQHFFKTASGGIFAHGKDPFFPPWTDTAQVNVATAAGRNMLQAELLSVAAQCDGVRCDMAMLLLPDIFRRTWNIPEQQQFPSFWKPAISAVLARHPQFLFIAESYWEREWYLQQEGFHFTYDKACYDKLRRADYHGLRQHLRAGLDYQDRCTRFLENHDEPRAAAAFGPLRGRSAAVATYCSPGMKLFYEGQLEGRRVKLPVQLARRPAESEDIEVGMFYEKLLGFLRHPVFQNGRFELCDVNSAGWNDNTNQSMLAYLWQSRGVTSNTRTTCLLVVINLSDQRAYGRIPLKPEYFGPAAQYVFYDNYDGKRYEREGKELNWPGLYVALEGHQSHLFEVR